ncbi:MAG: response regulator [Mucilaginibacter sp.]
MLNLSFRNQVLTGFAVSIILVLLVGLLSIISINKLEDDTILVEHSQQIVKKTDNLLQLIVDAETGVRGFVATGKPIYLDPYNSALPNITGDLNDLRALTINNPIQANRVEKFAELTNKQMLSLKADVDARNTKGLQYMVDNSMLYSGKEVMDRIRQYKNDLIDQENKTLDARKKSTAKASSETEIIVIAGSIIFLIIIGVLFYYIQKTFEEQKRAEETVRLANVELERVLDENEAKNWLLTGVSSLNEKIQGQLSERELSKNILAEICNYTNASTGTLYLFNSEEQRLELYASYAFHNHNALKKEIRLAEGWIGQAAENGKEVVIKGKLNDTLKLETSVLQEQLTESIIIPFYFDKQLKGVIEIAHNDKINDNTRNYLAIISNNIGVAINTAQARTIMHDLYEETQQQAEELEAQQEEMRVTNEELMNKTEMLEASEEELRVQQEELRSINAELEEKASLLEEKNQAIEEARQAINVKVDELETTGRYKSEFLANMSHELRTPLNSILVLARILKDNKTTNLTEDQIKYASVIFNAGNDLLTLINDILDLSKVESGKLELQIEDVKVSDIVKDTGMLFNELAANKKIKFTQSVSGVPEAISTDKIRAEQVLKNLLSNAFKFTPDGGEVTLNVLPGNKPQTISFSIKDSGVGIPKDKQKVIFEAFKQADGSTSRKYGGTGLGLSISRELSALLGGFISVSSEPGHGSEFTLTLPYKINHQTAYPAEEIQLPVMENIDVEDIKLKPAVKKAADKDPLIVIVEDDKNFAAILQDYARGHGYKSVMVHNGAEAVTVICENMPDAVILDIMLPGKDGWQILKELKQSEDTAAIPVHLMSANDTSSNRAQKEGAISFLKKPIDTAALDKLFTDMKQSGTEFKQILLVEDHRVQSQALKDMMQAQGIAVDQAFDGESAFRMLNENEYQCVILDLNLPDISGLDLLDKIKNIDKFAELPVIINTAMELDKSSVNRLMQYANAMVVKTNKSSDRLIDEVNLFLNKISEAKTKPAQAVKNMVMNKGKEALKGKKVLVVDDDMRNIFALSSVLESYDFIVDIANDGEEAITKLEDNPDIDIVLMDIMMPKMDGYEATRYIRKQSKWNKLPVIALTAKAMKDDREKCIAAGANDYITKPVDIDRLIALMQLWLGS